MQIFIWRKIMFIQEIGLVIYLKRNIDKGKDSKE